jgi:molybdopterin converting factor small subunit
MSRRAVEESLSKKISMRQPEERAEMKIIVEIPTAFRRFTNGSASLECAPATLAELLAELEQKFPAMARHLRDDSGRVRQFINVYVNEEDIRFLGGEAYRFQDGDRVMIVPSIAGG